MENFNEGSPKRSNVFIKKTMYELKNENPEMKDSELQKIAQEKWVEKEKKKQSKFDIDVSNNEDSDFMGEPMSSDSDSISSVLNDERYTKKIITKKNETFDKICDFMIKINELEKKNLQIENEYDKLEEKLRMTIIQLNNKNISIEELEIENNKLKEISKKHIERIMNIRKRALFRKKQVYILYTLLLLSLTENFYHGSTKFLYTLVLSFLRFLVFTNIYEIIILKNSIIIGLIIYSIYNKIYVNKISK